MLTELNFSAKPNVFYFFYGGPRFLTSNHGLTIYAAVHLHISLSADILKMVVIDWFHIRNNGTEGVSSTLRHKVIKMLKIQYVVIT